MQKMKPFQRTEARRKGVTILTECAQGRTFGVRTLALFISSEFFIQSHWFLGMRCINGYRIQFLVSVLVTFKSFNSHYLKLHKVFD